MAETEKIIDIIQFKRGSKDNLEAKLKKFSETENYRLLRGEPAWEIDTNKLKIGDGVHDYADLSYLKGEGNVNDPRFVITDPKKGNQLLFYDAITQKWLNKELTAEESIIYIKEDTSTFNLQGYDSASVGQMPLKSSTGLMWQTPVSDEQINAAVAAAASSATEATRQATIATLKADAAATSAQTAERINQQTMSWVNAKFWWGTVEEYNALESINPGTFYFVRTES